MSKAKTRSWTHVVAVAAAMSVALYVILEIEFPRLEFIRVDALTRSSSF